MDRGNGHIVSYNIPNLIDYSTLLFFFNPLFVSTETGKQSSLFYRVHEPRTNATMLIYYFAQNHAIGYTPVNILPHPHERLPHLSENSQKMNAKTGTSTLESLDNGVK